MTVTYTDRLALPWSKDDSEVRRFRFILSIVALLAVVIGIVIPLIDLPEKTREELEQVPPQLAQVLLEKREIEKKVELPKPIEEPKPEPEKEKPKPKPEEIKKPEPKPKPRVVDHKPVEVKSATDAAREVASQSGLMAMSDELADMREAFDANAFQSAPLSTVSAPAMAANTNDTLISQVSTQTSGGVDTSKLAHVTENVRTGSRQTTKIDAPKTGAGAIAAPTLSKRSGSANASRSPEEIRRIFDRNKSAIYAIYNRALRSNPALQGQVLLELTIEPSGSVSACKVVSSELADPDLEKRIAARVKLFNFGSKSVQQQVVTFPIDFLPS